MIRFIGTLLAILSFFITGCGERVDLAPVVESRWAVENKNQAVHRVLPGDTLYAIAFRYDKDYRELAAFNHLERPYALRVGQTLRLQYPNYPRKHINQQWSSSFSPRVQTSSRASAYPAVSPHNTSRLPLFRNSDNWFWPVHGRVVANFIPSQGKKGIDIASKKGEAVYASASGVVAYAGSGLRGYGNLIIIKHNSQYLTAYGNNAHNLVHEGQRINAGQRIAEVGVIDRRYWGVHFEIRQAGQPVNPLNYLKRGAD